MNEKAHEEISSAPHKLLPVTNDYVFAKLFEAGDHPVISEAMEELKIMSADEDLITLLSVIES